MLKIRLPGTENCVSRDAVSAIRVTESCVYGIPYTRFTAQGIPSLCQEVSVSSSLTLNSRRQSVRSLFSLIHELSLGVFEQKQLKEMWDATLWSFVGDLRQRGWTAKSVAQIYGMSRDSLYRTRDARPPEKIDLNSMCVIMSALLETDGAGLSLEEIDGKLRAHSRRHRNSMATMRLMKTLDILQSNGCIEMKRGRFFARSGTAFLDNLPREAVDDEFVRATAGAVRDKRNHRPHVLAVYTMMAPAETEARRAFMARADAAFEKVLTELEEWAVAQGETSPCQIAIGTSEE